MPRSRNLKPGFFANEDLIELPFEARLLFAGLWTLADREGRLEDRPKKIKLHIFPGDDVDVNGGLEALSHRKFIVRYKVREGLFIQIVNWEKHQRPHAKEAVSQIPAPEKNGQAPEIPVRERLLSSSLIPDSPFPITDSSSLRSPEVAQKRDPSPVERVFEHWRTEHRHPKAQLDAKRRRRISEALKSYAEADLCLAISGYKNSPHHMGQNDTSTVFDSLELFLRDAEHIDAGLKFARGPPSAPKSAVELARERLRNGSSDERVVGEQSGGSVGPAPRLLRG